jgi:hypothetical protein
LPSGTPTLLATQLYYGVQLALTSTHVYWTSWGGGVGRVPLTGGTTQTVGAQVSGTFGIAVDATDVYFTNALNDSVSSAPLGGGPTSVLAGGQNAVENVTVDATHVYWTTRNSGSLRVARSRPANRTCPLTRASVSRRRQAVSPLYAAW